ncbi:MAG: TetR/AcrR family transcriptional regulator [Spirochaetia bacterium]|nr:TetR/AcrR family transcriptional regulator [Spirochaetia bacterium]MDY3721388.1 TetR/AcrR family transcriptional regulator [Treponema sp.]
MAAKLFLEKGYENISLNDIIKNLGGLTKGAIYSHFKSKEETYQAVIYQMSASSDDAIEEIIKSDQLNGGRIDYSKNPRMLYALLLELKDEVAPLFIYDGTI